MLGGYRLLKGVRKCYKGVERGLQGATKVTGIAGGYRRIEGFR